MTEVLQLRGLAITPPFSVPPGLAWFGMVGDTLSEAVLPNTINIISFKRDKRQLFSFRLIVPQCPNQGMQVNNQGTMLHTIQFYAGNHRDGAGQVLLKKIFFPTKSAEQVF